MIKRSFSEYKQLAVFNVERGSCCRLYFLAVLLFSFEGQGSLNLIRQWGLIGHCVKMGGGPLKIVLARVFGLVGMFGLLIEELGFAHLVFVD
jgi:hypothetical protein